jgi:uncharacterized repeat protein (TIGR01451 family)
MKKQQEQKMSTLNRALYRLSPAVALGLGLTALVLLGFLLTEAQSSAIAQTPANQTPAASLPGIITATDRHLERDGLPFEAQGMNYYPKDYAWDRFWISYTAAITQINTELDLSRALGVNTVRIFLRYKFFNGSDQADPYLDHLVDFVDRLQARDMVAIVTLFDFYASDSTTPYSTTDYLSSTRHISAVVHTLGITNPTVLVWDLKNELDRDYYLGETMVKAWATEMLSYIRGLDPNHMVTIGFYGVTTGTLCYAPAVTNTLVYSPAIAAEFAPLVDFVSMHYFLSERCFEGDLQTLQSQIGEKPLVLEEFGLPTDDDPHTETEQAAYYNALLSLSEAYGLAGYLFWTLNDLSYVPSISPGPEQCMGILRNSLVDTCQVTTTLDYTEKPAADTVRRHYNEHVHYLDLFDGWVDPKTDEAPPGWSDNYDDGGGLLRGYNPPSLLWSHDLGKVAFSRSGILTTGLALSPILTNVNVDRYPFLSGQVFSYSVRDITYGSDSTLHIGVKKDDAQITRLLTVTRATSLPYSFSLDLRQPPVGWSGSQSFQIVFELVPEGKDNGYSATYEFDWVALAQAMLKAAKQANPNPVQDGARLTYTIRVTNTGYVSLNAIITDTLPARVTPTGMLTWTPPTIAPGGVWTQTVVVTVNTGYTGSLTNKVRVTTEEGAMGTTGVTVCANRCLICLPVVLRQSP